MTDTKALSSKEIYINLLRSVKRENCNIEGLIEYLEKNDFFNSPASTQYFGSYSGGLCVHSLDVYYILKDLISVYSTKQIEEDTIILVALLHDLYKLNYYKTDIMNKKVYSDKGKKFDELGTFDWVSSKVYRTKELSEVNFFGTPGITSLMYAQPFVNFTEDEKKAIINFQGNQDEKNYAVASIFSTCNLALLLHVADLMACFLVSNSQTTEDRAE